MIQIFSQRVIWACCLAVMLSFNPTASWGVVELKIEPEHEYEAAFCLGLLGEVAPQIDFDNARKIELIAESLSFAPDRSLVSRQGRLAAAGLIAENPSMAMVSSRLNVCSDNLGNVIKSYLAHSCGFGIGALSEEWSSLDLQAFYDLFLNED